MSDFDKFLRDQFGDEEEQFPRKAENWEKLSKRLDGVGIQGESGNAMRLLRTAAQRWAVAASIVSLLALNGWAMWQWQEAIRENTALQQTIFEHDKAQAATATQQAAANTQNEIIANLQNTTTVPSQTSTPSIATPGATAVAPINPPFPLTGVKPVATKPLAVGNSPLNTATQQKTDNAKLKTANASRITPNASLNTPVATEPLMANNAQLTTDNPKLITPNTQLITDNSKLTTPNAQRTTDNAQLTTDNSKLTTPNAQLTTLNKPIPPVFSTRSQNHALQDMVLTPPTAPLAKSMIQPQKSNQKGHLTAAVVGVLGQNITEKEGVGQAKGFGLEVEFRPIRNFGIYASVASLQQAFEVEVKNWQPTFPPRPGGSNNGLNNIPHPISRSKVQLREMSLPPPTDRITMRGNARMRPVQIGARWVISTKTWIQPTVSIGHTWNSWTPETAVLTFKDRFGKVFLERSGTTEKSRRDNLWHAGISLEKPTRYGTFFAAASLVRDIRKQSDDTMDDKIPTMAMLNAGVRLNIF
jgi:hypothetical protein